MDLFDFVFANNFVGVPLNVDQLAYDVNFYVFFLQQVMTQPPTIIESNWLFPYIYVFWPFRAYNFQTFFLLLVKYWHSFFLLDKEIANAECLE